MEKSPVLVLDASVAVKWYVKEEMHDIALKLRDHFVSELIDLEAPSLILYELGNALRYHPATTAMDCAEAVRQLRNIGLVLHELDDNLIGEAASIAHGEHITFYDAVYLALAKTLETRLVTGDAALLDQLSQENKPSIMLLKDYEHTIGQSSIYGSPVGKAMTNEDRSRAKTTRRRALDRRLHKGMSTLDLVGTGTRPQKEILERLDEMREEDNL